MDTSHFGTVHAKPIWLKAAKCLEHYPEKFYSQFYIHWLGAIFVIIKLKKSKWKPIKGIMTTI